MCHKNLYQSESRVISKTKLSSRELERVRMICELNCSSFKCLLNEIIISFKGTIGAPINMYANM